jgi:hypothetical protein
LHSLLAFPVRGCDNPPVQCVLMRFTLRNLDTGMYDSKFECATSANVPELLQLNSETELFS